MNNLNISAFVKDYLIEFIGQRFRILIMAMWYILNFRTDGTPFDHTKTIYVSFKLTLCNAFAQAGTTLRKTHYNLLSKYTISTIMLFCRDPQKGNLDLLCHFSCVVLGESNSFIE